MNSDNDRKKRKVSVAPPAKALSVKRQHVEKKLEQQQRVGNFRSYYSYRLGQKHQGELEDDPRLAALDKSWFDGKRGLDIGCNSGEFTITIAKRLAPSYLLGVDVDPQLISRARGHLKDILRQEQIEKAFRDIPAAQSIDKEAANGAIGTGASGSGDATTDVVEAKQEVTENKEVTKDTDGHTKPSDDDMFADSMPLSFRFWKPPAHGQGTTPSRAIGKTAVGSVFPLNVIFKREDIVLNTHAGKDYDFVTCFSVTKWIHLFHGDEGLKGVFAKIYKLLAPGGRLVLEPQPWKSYHKRKFTSDVTATNYPKIQLRPKDFPTYLVDTVGFRSCELLEVCQTSSKGFRRPVYVAQK